MEGSVKWQIHINCYDSLDELIRYLQQTFLHSVIVRNISVTLVRWAGLLAQESMQYFAFPVAQ